MFTLTPGTHVHSNSRNSCSSFSVFARDSSHLETLSLGYQYTRTPLRTSGKKLVCETEKLVSSRRGTAQWEDLKQLHIFVRVWWSIRVCVSWPRTMPVLSGHTAAFLCIMQRVLCHGSSGQYNEELKCRHFLNVAVKRSGKNRCNTIFNLISMYGFVKL